MLRKTVKTDRLKSDDNQWAAPKDFKINDGVSEAISGLAATKVSLKECSRNRHDRKRNPNAEMPQVINYFENKP